jgi:predicted enzyme related to lactoylglutathione lyase
MADIQKHDPGTFCWLELGTTDRAAAVRFYNELFGWANHDNLMGKDVYTIFKLKGRDAAAAYALDDEMKSRGIPPHWMLYVTVESADDAAARVTSLGGQVMSGPFDVMTLGRMAVVQDPQGAHFSLWQPKDHVGIGVKDEHGAFCWPELNTTDAKAALGFYEGVFGWGHKTDKPGDATAYTEWKLANRSIGGMMQIQPEWGPVPSNWMPYIMVADCDATVAKAQTLGGMAIVPPMDIAEVGRFSVLHDPQGAHFAVIAMRMK